MAGERIIHVSRALVEQLWRMKGGDALPNKLMLAIRGATPMDAGGDLIRKTPNNPGFYNDAVGLVLGNSVQLFPGTTDAGSIAQLEQNNENNPKGIFHLNDGIHRVRHHSHQAAKPTPGWLDSRKAWHVFTPGAGDNAQGWRDVNDTDFPDAGDNMQATSDAINVHWGASIQGGNPLKTRVTINSVGCLNVVRDFWVTFRNLGYSQLPDPGFLLVADSSLIVDPVEVAATPLRLSINQNEIPTNLLNLWEDPPGRATTYARTLLDLLKFGGQPLQYEFKANPDRLVFKVPAGRTLNLTMKRENNVNRGVAGVGDLLRALDPNIDIHRSVDDRLIVATSGLVGYRDAV
jgi:hypothetical protein